MLDIRYAARRALPALGLGVALAALACGDDPAEPLPGKAHVQIPEDYPDLASAIEAWNFGDTLSIAPGVHSGEGFRDIVLDTRFVAIVGRNPENPPTIDLEELGQAFVLQDGSTLYLRDLVFRRGLSGIGGVLRVTESEARLERVRIERSASRYGGAIVVERGQLRMDGCQLRGNEATEIDAGAIYATLSDLVLTRTIVAGNRAEVGGGAISLDRSHLVATSCTFAANHAQNGGAFRVTRSSLVELVRSIVRGNEAGDGSDAAVVAASATLHLDCSAIDTLAVSGALASAEDVIALDPRFCDPVPAFESPTTLGNYGIRADSPCAAESAPCGLLVGARDVGCESGRLRRRM